MAGKKIRIYLSMALALIIVLGYESFIVFLVQADYRKIASLYRARQAKVNVTPTPGEFFEPTTVPEIVWEPSATPVPTMRIVPTVKKTPTAIPSKIPTRAPTRVPTRKPTVKPTSLPVPATRASASKLSIFMIGSYTAGMRAILESNPRIVKVIEPNSDPAFYEAIRAYRKRRPDGITMVRFYNGTPGLYYPVTSDPEASAEDFFAKVIKPGAQALGSNKTLFDYMQNPNEFENTPEWRGEANMKWNGSFWRRLTELGNTTGIKTCIGGIPVGNIEPAELGFILEDLKAMHAMGAAFCYHGYTFNYSHDTSHEIFYSLRYRQYYEYFRQNAPELLSMPLILSEGGVAEGGDPRAGYLKSGKTEDYKSWLAWYDAELKKDAYVKGVTLFQIGNSSDWGYFDLESIAPWMAGYLKSN